LANSGLLTKPCIVTISVSSFTGTNFSFVFPEKTATIRYIVIALHACDTATDDSIAWAVKNSAKVIMLAPCCHHDLQAQVDLVPEPWSLLTRHGVVSERLIDLMTDSLRAQILKLLGYRVDIVEFIGGEHTPRNIMIRAVKTGVKVDPVEVDRYQAMLADWSIAPHLAELLKSELSARI
jgi:hypothetical protein